MMYCIYHSRDLDGFCSGAICLRKYPDAVLIGYDYGEPIPFDKIPRNNPVIMVDVSLSMTDMIRLSLYTGKQLTWIDHHKSAIDDYEELNERNPTQAGYINAVLKEGVAACELIWEYLFDIDSMPIIVSILGEFDTWRNQNKSNWNMIVMPVQYGMRYLNIQSAEDFPQDEFESTTADIMDLVKTGTVVLKYQKIIDAENMKSAFDVTFEGRKAIACNGAGLGSMAFDSVYDESKYDLMIPFKFNGEVWQFSLYTTNDSIDCGQLAKKYGGGGHPKAAGFITDKIPEFLLNK